MAGPSRVTRNRDDMRALMIQVVCIQVVCIQVVCIQVVCATGLRTDGCATLHPLRVPALIAWVERNGRRHQGSSCSLNASLTLSIIDTISCANENFAF